MATDRPRNHGALVTGLVIVAVGFVLLLDRLGLVYAGTIFRFWPVILIIAGTAGLFRHDRRGKFVVSGLLVLVGAVFLGHELGYWLGWSWREIWPVFLIAAGLLLIGEGLRPSRWKFPVITNPNLNDYIMFGSSERQITAHDFQSAQIHTVFGGFKVDLTQAAMAGDRAFLDMNIIFGGGEIRLPYEWSVTIEAIALFGAYEDKTRHPQQPSKVLVVRGKTIFGGVEFRN